MYDFTKNEMEIIKDNLMSFIANFGKPRIERGDIAAIEEVLKFKL